MMKEKSGIIQVYTGNGKGKTTAALGAAIRAIGYGKKVLMIQFMKGSQQYGELLISKKLPNFTIISSGRNCFVDKAHPTQRDRELAQSGLLKAREKIASGKYDMLILDELNVAIDFSLIKVEDVLEFFKSKPNKLEIIVTGRNAHPKIIYVADLVSEMKEIKHHYKKGIKGKKGIEY